MDKLNEFAESLMTAMEIVVEKHIKSTNDAVATLTSNFNVLNQNVMELMKDRQVNIYKITQDDMAFVDMMTEIKQDYKFVTNKIATVENCITDLPCKKDEELYTKIMELNGSFFDTGEHVFIILNADGDVSLINAKGAEVIGLPKEEIIGKNWIEDFIPEHRKDKAVEIRESVLNIGVSAFKVIEYGEILTQSGNVVKVKWRNSIIKDNGEGVIGFIGVGELIGTNGTSSQST